MQISLSSSPKHVASTSGGLLLVGESDEARDRQRHEREHEEAVAAALAPNDPTSIINRDERDVTRTSRAFKRQVSRDEGMRQFREDRQSFRETLTDAAREGKREAPSESRAAGKSESAKPRADAPPDKQARATASADSKHARSDGRQARPAAQAVEDAGRHSRASASVAAAASTSALRGAPNVSSIASTSPPTGVRAGAGVANVARGAGISRPAGAGARANTTAALARETFRIAGAASKRAGRVQHAQNADREANIDRIVRVVRASFAAKHSHAVMRITPPELGSLRLQLDLRGESLSLRIDTSSDVAHRLLLEDVEKLRSGLEASGVQLERVEVRPPTPASMVGEQATSQDADTPNDAQGGSAQAGAEHAREQGTDSLHAGSSDGETSEDHSEPAAESLVNVIA